MFAETLAIIALTTFLAWVVARKGFAHTLPSVKGLPFFGILHKLEYHRLAQQLTQIGKDFKGMLYIGSNILVIDDKDTAKEILVKQDPKFADKLNGAEYLILTAVGDDTIGGVNYNEKLQMMRKATFKALHLHGSGLQKLEGIVHEEVRTFLDVLQEKAGTDIAPTELVYATVINIMASILLGEKFSYDSEEVRSIHDLDQRVSALAVPFNTPEINLFPWMLNLPFPRYTRKKQELQEFITLRKNVMNTFVYKYKDSYDPDNIHCVLSSLLKTQATHGSDVFTDQMVNGIMLSLIMGGSLTTSTSTSGLLFILAHKPEVQDRMYAEIQEVVGDGRLPRAEDKESLPYVSAVILELLRYQTIAPMNVPRVATCDVEINGHLIPKKTKIMVNQWAIHHNPEEWEKPHDFYPEHFLDKQGHLLPVDQYMMRGFLPFGGGRRGCPGETLAKNRIFLMTTAIVQRFKITPPAQGKLPGMTTDDFIYDGVMKPQNYEVQFVSRE